PHLEGRDGQLLVVHGARRAREVQYVVDRAGDVDVVGDVELDETEALGPEPLDVVTGAGREVVEAQDLGPLVEQELAQVRADEPRAPGHQHAHGRLAQAGKTGFRPIEWYSNPSRRIR